MQKLKISYYYSNEIGQPDQFHELAKKFTEVEFSIVKIDRKESEKFSEQGIKAVPFVQVSRKTDSSFSEVLRLYGDQSQIELETLIKENM